MKDLEDISIDEHINANMSVSDDRLRAAIHAVCVDVIYAAAATEREACAKVCEVVGGQWNDPVCMRYAAAIRARGEI